MGQALDRLLADRGVALAATTVEIVPESQRDTTTAAEPDGLPSEDAWKSALDLVSANAGVFEKAPDLAAAYSDLQTAVASQNQGRAAAARFALVLADQRRFISPAVSEAVSRLSLGLRDTVCQRPGSDMTVPLAGPPAFLAAKKGKGKNAPTDKEAAEATKDNEATEPTPVGDMAVGDHFVHPDDKQKHRMLSKKGGTKAGGKPAPWMVRSAPVGKGGPKAKMFPPDAKLAKVKAAAK